MSDNSKINTNRKEASEKCISEIVNPEEVKMLPYNKTMNEQNEYECLSEDTKCGIWCFKGEFLQKFANKKVYVFLYGIVGCIFTACYSYSTGTITTIEKRFKIPSKNTGIISIGNDITQLFISIILNYFAGRGHRPRWMAFGLYTVVVYCMMNAMLHVIYGAGEDALLLTTEYGATFNENTTQDVLDKFKRQTLCSFKNGTQCESEESNLAPQVILFVAQLISGIGGSLYFTLGISYMDDNTKKAKTPALISLSYFLRMLGPALGYSLAYFCLKFYIAPTLTPTITTKDPRWLGAWWMGWTVIGAMLFIFASLLGLFPKTLPKTVERNKLKMQEDEETDQPTSFRDMITTFKRLTSNVILMLNNFASVFYIAGYLPYWTFMPKYIEIQYRQSASVANLITGSVGLVFSAFGILVSGVVITKFKPKARSLAMWNIIVSAISVLGIFSYAYLGCTENDNRGPLLTSGELKTDFTCNYNCSCEFVKYSPVCSEDGTTTFISACHAGCKQQQVFPNGTKIFTDCSCIRSEPRLSSDNSTDGLASDTQTVGSSLGGVAFQGSCAVNCDYSFYTFLIVLCSIKFFGATEMSSNFLVSVRCVEERDKAVSMGFGLMLITLFAFIPSPILFGYILDQTCLVWGRTCFGTGNCWLYNSEMLRYTMHFTAASIIAVGMLLDVGVWYYVKDLKIFDEETKLDKKQIQESTEYSERNVSKNI